MFKIIKAAKWENSNELKEQLKNASIIGKNRVVFNIKGNDYRLVVHFVYKYQLAYIRFVGTHKKYNKIDVKTV